MTRDPNEVRLRVLDEMAHADRFKVAAIMAAAIAESGGFIAAFWLIDWDNQTHVLIFAMTMLVYLVLALGMIALGSHMSRNTLRIIAAIESATAGAPQ